MNSWINLSALWRIVVVGLLAGAGLPALFAVGLRALAAGSDSAAVGTDEDRVIGGSRAGMAFAGFCFAVVLAAIGYGIYLIVKAS
ncbi:MAG TPA: hypothetical protein VK662_06640 [Acidothermaceae bacterium]|jgi:hypothetical protein|nr:hypothetical protein [Acidothermaceae bacterium]